MSNNSIYTETPTYFYTYQIYNTHECKFYIGSRKCTIDPIKDLGIKYFSSSKDKDFIKDQKQNPQDYEYTVLGIHSSRRDAFEEEKSLHNAYNVAKNPRFYNKARVTSSGFTIDHHSEETKQKMSEARIGKTLSEEHKRKISEANAGKTLSEEHKQKISEARTGKIHSEETKRKISEVQIGKTLSEEHRRKISEVQIGKIHSEETKRKISEAKIGKTRAPFSEEHKRRLSESRIGKRWIFNTELKITRRISADEPIPDGWSLGRKIFK